MVKFAGPVCVYPQCGRQHLCGTHTVLPAGALANADQPLGSACITGMYGMCGFRLLNPRSNPITNLVEDLGGDRCDGLVGESAANWSLIGSLPVQYCCYLGRGSLRFPFAQHKIHNDRLSVTSIAAAGRLVPGAGSPCSTARNSAPHLCHLREGALRSRMVAGHSLAPGVWLALEEGQNLEGWCCAREPTAKPPALALRRSSGDSRSSPPQLCAALPPAAAACAAANNSAGAAAAHRPGSLVGAAATAAAARSRGALLQSCGWGGCGDSSQAAGWAAHGPRHQVGSLPVW